MYCNHYGFSEKPFDVTPDPRFLFLTPDHRETLASIVYGIRERRGFITIIGEVGTGKTLVCRKLLNLLDDNYVTAYLPNPFLSPTALRMALAEELGIEFARNIGQHRLLKLITERLIELHGKGRQVVLLLDEAQAMPDDSLEALRLLTNLETEKRKLLQVVLFGQPELDTRLAEAKLRQLKQRIVFSYRLSPLDCDTVGRYVTHRMQVAGYRGPALFTDKAITRLHRSSRGIPRLVNLLCHKSLMAAYGSGLATVRPAHITYAAMDTEDVRFHGPRRVAIASGLAGLIACASAGLLYAYTL